MELKRGLRYKHRDPQGYVSDLARGINSWAGRPPHRFTAVWSGGGTLLADVYDHRESGWDGTPRSLVYGDDPDPPVSPGLMPMGGTATWRKRRDLGYRLCESSCRVLNREWLRKGEGAVRLSMWGVVFAFVPTGADNRRKCFYVPDETKRRRLTVLYCQVVLPTLVSGQVWEAAQRWLEVEGE